jgi:hypothetical protein
MGALSEESFRLNLLLFLGHPFSVLTMAGLVAAYNTKQLLVFSDKVLAAAGLIILIIGAGGRCKTGPA